MIVLQRVAGDAWVFMSDGGGGIRACERVRVWLTGTWLAENRTGMRRKRFESEESGRRSSFDVRPGSTGWVLFRMIGPVWAEQIGWLCVDECACVCAWWVVAVAGVWMLLAVGLVVGGGWVG